jgi:aerobic-type carbon monoxide dehydrogenase small subunit (CoxS/CutS family)
MQGRSVTTIEGLVFLEASTEHHFKVSHDSILDQQLTSGKPSTLNNHLHIMQQAFLDHGALQCGYCTPGMIMRAVSLVDEKIPIDPHAIAHALGGNLCRCTGYSGIVLAVMQGLRVLRNEVES